MRNDMLYSALVVGVIMAIANIACIHQMITQITMNHATFYQAGMMQYVNPADGKQLFIPVYSKENLK